jgi:hypothetical protein
VNEVLIVPLVAQHGPEFRGCLWSCGFDLRAHAFPAASPPLGKAPAAVYHRRIV